MKIPTLIHESNAVPGLTTKLLSGRVDKILVAFPDVARLYKYPAKVIFTGTPIRAGFLPQNKNDARLLLGIDGVVVKAHGSSKAKSFESALKQAMTAVERDVVGSIRQSLLTAFDDAKS
jgi:UDP-N-acetylglucosamine--N-acetylmuramyl-(pentapeptide) pyrophosphoryl-undecaprenol N-acetylglucosamine transferase